MCGVRFVILHGTDTMSYTASALSFMLENLGKTVVLTGAMSPLEGTVLCLFWSNALSGGMRANVCGVVWCDVMCSTDQ